MTTHHNPNALSISICNSVEEAPNWVKDHSEVNLIDIEKAIIVKNGTTDGKCTVDIVVRDTQGNRFAGMLTGDLILHLAKAILVEEGKS